MCPHQALPTQPQDRNQQRAWAERKESNLASGRRSPGMTPKLPRATPRIYFGVDLHSTADLIRPIVVDSGPCYTNLVRFGPSSADLDQNLACLASRRVEITPKWLQGAMLQQFGATPGHLFKGERIGEQLSRSCFTSFYFFRRVRPPPRHHSRPATRRAYGGGSAPEPCRPSPKSASPPSTAFWPPPTSPPRVRAPMCPAAGVGKSALAPSAPAAGGVTHESNIGRA